MSRAAGASDGRRTHRADGRQRRRALLEATLRLIARDGIRGVRHRAVAREAGVPLAATTYYFKDLADLITDAFLSFSETAHYRTDALEQASREAVDRYRSGALDADALVDAVTDLLVEHMTAQVRERDGRLVEHSFNDEMLRNESLAEAVRGPERAQLALMQRALADLGSDDPESDARLILGVVLREEHELLLDGLDPTTVARTRRIVRRTIDSIVARVRD